MLGVFARRKVLAPLQVNWAAVLCTTQRRMALRASLARTLAQHVVHSTQAAQTPRITLPKILRTNPALPVLAAILALSVIAVTECMPQAGL